MYFVEILHIISHYLLLFVSFIYSGSLPSGASESLVRELMAALSSKPKLSPLVDICRAFIGSYDLKQRKWSTLNTVAIKLP